MNPQMNGWVKSSHHAVATCNDCHTPKGAVGWQVWMRVRGARHRLAAAEAGTFEMRNLAMDAVVALIEDLARRVETGAPDAELAAAREHHRRARFLPDFVEAESSMGFHADQEAMRAAATSAPTASSAA